jgi:hypothetical protein
VVFICQYSVFFKPFPSFDDHCRDFRPVSGGGRSQTMISLVVTVTSSLGLGMALFILLRLQPQRLVHYFFSAVAAGLGVWIYLTLALGYAQLWRPGALIGIAAGASLASILVVFLQRENFRLPGSPLRGVNGWGRVYGAVVIFICCATCIASFAPVTGGIRNDEICLHLSVVRWWLGRGCLPVPHEAISYQAGNAHLLFLLPAAMGSAAGQRLVTWLCFILSLWAIWTISRWFLDKNRSLLAVLMAAINPLIFRTAGTAFVDLQSSLFVLLPVVMLLEYRRGRQGGWLVLCGLFLGAGVGIKPTNYVYAAVFCGLSLCAALIRRATLKELSAAFICIALLGAPLCLHWPVRTLVLTGSPVFPPPLVLYKNGDLKPLNGKPPPFSYNEVKGYYDYVMSRYGDYKRGLVNFSKLPWDITMNPSRFQIGDSIGTVFLSLFPFLLCFLCEASSDFYW